jgi:hypothetical protein
MFKIKIHIDTKRTYFDDNVFVDVELPAIPRVGEYIDLDDDLVEQLEDKATSDIEIARDYVEWFYCNSTGIEPKDLKQENFEDLGFCDACMVSAVKFVPGSDIVSIELMR